MAVYLFASNYPSRSDLDFLSSRAPSFDYVPAMPTPDPSRELELRKAGIVPLRPGNSERPDNAVLRAAVRYAITNLTDGDMAFFCPMQCFLLAYEEPTPLRVPYTNLSADVVTVCPGDGVASQLIERFASSLIPGETSIDYLASAIGYRVGFLRTVVSLDPLFLRPHTRDGLFEILLNSLRFLPFVRRAHARCRIDGRSSLAAFSVLVSFLGDPDRPIREGAILSVLSRTAFPFPKDSLLASTYSLMSKAPLYKPAAVKANMPGDLTRLVKSGLLHRSNGGYTLSQKAASLLLY